MKHFARTAEEADLFVDLECEERGEVPVSRKRKRAERRRRPVWVYEIRCQSGKLIELEFEEGGLPEPKPGLRRRVRFGGQQASLLIDAGEWLLVADRAAAAAPRSVAGLAERDRRAAFAHLDRALAAIDEVMKFIPAGATRVPESALFSDRGRRHYAKDVRRFERAAVEAMRSELEARRRRFESSRV